MKVICLVKVKEPFGDVYFYAGCPNVATGYLEAARRGFESDRVTCTMIANKIGLSEGEWRLGP